MKAVTTSTNALTQKLAPVLLGIHFVALPLYPHMPFPVLLLTVIFTVWALLIIALVAFGFATKLIGMVLVLPLLGHATWNAYRDIVEEA